MTRARFAPLILLAALLGTGGAAAPAGAEGAALNGLMAPELTFPSGLNGIQTGGTLSSFRGRVVWIKFWLRDCPRCRKTLPSAQEMHELYGSSGLVVLTIVHQYGPDQVRPFMQQHGYTFPVVCDPTGSLAQLFQVNHRPTDYLVGINGRIMVSNAAPDDAILGELTRQRVAELGRVPSGLEQVSQHVEAWNYGAALREASKAAAAPEASAEVRALATRVELLAVKRLVVDLERAQTLWRRQRTEEAGRLLGLLAAGYAGTPHAETAAAALKAFKDAKAG